MERPAASESLLAAASGDDVRLVEGEREEEEFEEFEEEEAEEFEDFGFCFPPDSHSSDRNPG